MSEELRASLQIVSAATDEEVAAVTAVLQGALDEGAEANAIERPVVSAWQHSQRAVRTPLTPGPGAWRSFTG